MLSSIDAIVEELAAFRYVVDRPLATILYLSRALEKPLFLEGEPGVGKTELAAVLARALDTPFIRLQCYEGLDVSTALYEWNYPRQILEIKLQETRGDTARLRQSLFEEEFLIRRPILRALQHPGPRPAVLLIDEIDRADEEFEALLLEALSDFQVTIPELGTLRAQVKPLVVLTSNRTRDVHDAVKRRCLYHWIEYPSLQKEYAIVRSRLPGIDERLAAEVCRFVQRVRKGEFLKKPGIAETLDWAAALIALNRHALDEEVVEATLGCLFKVQEDTAQFRETVWRNDRKRGEYLAAFEEGGLC